MTGVYTIDVSVNSDNINEPRYLFINYSSLGQPENYYTEVTVTGGSPKIIRGGKIKRGQKIESYEGGRKVLRSLLVPIKDEDGKFFFILTGTPASEK